ncbi:MAG: DUF89 family protein [Phycisphaeraceae bacterium]|nr:DUF89 family protein [Phycisphaeraceae bacterium]
MTPFVPLPSGSPLRPWGDQALPLLAQPASYVACSWDLRAAPDRLAYWLGLFRRHFPSLLEETIAEAVDRGENRDDARHRADECSRKFESYLQSLAEQPGRYGRLDILEICFVREEILREANFPDPYRLAKHRENEAALRLLPSLLAQLDAMPEADLPRRLIEGIFAGNIFDLGATQTAELFERGKTVDFHQVRSKLPPRPWLIDCLDAWLRWIARPNPCRAALVFVDNAGSDIVLGMIPFVRDLLRRGANVIVAVNAFPSLNDVTIDELKSLFDQVVKVDEPLASALREGRLELVSSGNGAPLIDLSHVSRELADACRRLPIDLVVIEGMGRAIESNLHAIFTCPAMKIAMVKDKGVADALGGKVYDLVMRLAEV